MSRPSVSKVAVVLPVESVAVTAQVLGAWGSSSRLTATSMRSKPVASLSWSMTSQVALSPDALIVPPSPAATMV